MNNIHNIVALATLASLIPCYEATKVSSAVKVHLPKDLQRANGYDHREALFGIPPYGGSIMQNVQYAEEDLCSPFTPPKHWKSPFILMVTRGGCTFVQKVRNGQHAGAVAVVIADNVCQCKHEKVCVPEANTECEKHEPIMADDGSGDDITIPSVLMFKQDADPIKESLKKNKNVMLELTWSLPNPDDHVEWDLWTTPTDFLSLEFVKDFRPAALALASRVTFTPHMYLYDGIEARCRNDEGINLCKSMCTNGGRYCAIGEQDSEPAYLGIDVVKESARRLCIWELFGDDGTGLEWWDYVNGFTETCDNLSRFNDEECVKEVMEEVGLEFDRVEQCIVDHGGLEADVTNDMIEKQLDDKKSNGVVIMPVTYVNGVVVRGALEFATIFKAICAGFKTGTQPSICAECANCSDEKQCVLNGKCADNHPPKLCGGDDDFHNDFDDDLISGVQDQFLTLLPMFPPQLLQCVGLDQDSSFSELPLQFLHKQNKCSEEETNVFKQGIADFDKCTGWNVIELINQLPSILVGNSINCLNLSLDLDRSVDDDSVIDNDIRGCFWSLFGDNPFGSVIHDIILNSENICSCYSSLHESPLPECTLDHWPIPLSGIAMNSFSCAISFGCRYHDMICDLELDKLNNCLPELDEIYYKECETISEICLGEGSMLFLDPAVQIPLPGVCRKSYSISGRHELVDRYDAYSDKCLRETMEVWNKHVSFKPSADNFQDENDNDLVEKDIPEDQIGESSSSQITVKRAFEHPDEEPHSVKNSETTDESLGKSGSPMFIILVTSAAFIGGVVTAYLAMRLSQNKGKYNVIEQQQMPSAV